MVLVNADKINKSYTEKPLLKDISLSIHENEKIGLIGVNGTGKSTIFNIITKRIKADSGTYSIGTKVDIGYFDQHSSDLWHQIRLYRKSGTHTRT